METKPHPKYVEALKELKTVQEPMEAVELLAELIGKPRQIERRPVKFDSGTGKPIQYKWFAQRDRDNKFVRVYLDDGFCNNIELSHPVRRYLRYVMNRGGTVIHTPEGSDLPIVISGFTAESNPGVIGGRGSEVNAGVEISLSRGLESDIGFYEAHVSKRKKHPGVGRKRTTKAEKVRRRRHTANG